MPRLARNKYLDAFLKLLLVSAVVHVAVLVFQTIVRGSIAPLNYFAILDLQFFFPGIETGVLSNTLSLSVVAIIYILLIVASRGESPRFRKRSDEQKK